MIAILRQMLRQDAAGLNNLFVVVKVATGLASDDAFRRATRELRHFALVRSPKLVTIFDRSVDTELIA